MLGHILLLLFLFEDSHHLDREYREADDRVINNLGSSCSMAVPNAFRAPMFPEYEHSDLSENTLAPTPFCKTASTSSRILHLDRVHVSMCGLVVDNGMHCPRGLLFCITTPWLGDAGVGSRKLWPV